MGGLETARTVGTATKMNHILTYIASLLASILILIISFALSYNDTTHNVAVQASLFLSFPAIALSAIALVGAVKRRNTGG